MTVGQVEYLQDLSDGRLRISDFDISCIGFIYFRQVNGTFGQVIFSCDQAALRTLQSVRPSVTPFSPCFCHRIITKFSGVITIDKSDFRAKGQGRRSKVKVTRGHDPT